MAAMSREQRAQSYLKRLISASNKEAEIVRILEELNSLVYSSNNKPLSKQDKILIIEAVEEIYSQQLIQKNESLDFVTNASDNSGVIDIIGALKRGVKD